MRPQTDNRRAFALFTLLAPLLVLASCDSSLQPNDRHGVFLIGNIPFPYSSNGLFVAENYAYVANDTFGLRIVDIMSPAYPELISTFRTADHASAVCVSGRYAYLAENNSGLEIIDIYDPAQPMPVGAGRLAVAPYDITVSGRYAYIADGDYGLRVIDVSNPASPSQVSQTATLGPAHDLAMSGEHIYLAYSAGEQNSRNGFQIISIASPTAPVSIFNYTIDGLASGVWEAGSNAFIGGKDLLIFNVNNPSSAQLLGKYENLGGRELCVADGEIYVSIGYYENGTNYGGLAVFSYDNPVYPIILADYRTGGSSFDDIFVSGGYVFMTGIDTGLSIFEYVP